MGLFDSIYLDVKCPACGKVNKQLECQTKALFKSMIHFKVGDTICDKFEGVWSFAICTKCRTSLDVWIDFKKGKITGKYKAEVWKAG